MKQRADDVTKDMRIRTVAEWILLGFSTSDILAQCTAKWGIDKRMGYKYKKAAFLLFKEARKGTIQERVDFYVSAKLKIYNELKDKQTPKGASVANDILDSMARLEGAITESIDITSGGKSIKPEIDLSQVPTEILEQLLTIANKKDE